MNKLTLTNNVNHKKNNITTRAATSDRHTFQQIFIDEVYNLKSLKRYPEFEALYATYSATGVPLILDIGANIGLASIYFQHIWPGSQVVAVEPSEENFRVMVENFGNDSNFEALLAGIASRPSRLAILDPSVDKNSFITTIAEVDDTRSIEGVTVPELLADYPRSKGYFPFIIKIDIEGFESELFSTNTEWINEFPILILEMHDWLFVGQQTSSSFLKTISQLDRDFIYMGENVFSIKNDRSGLATEIIVK